MKLYNKALAYTILLKKQTGSHVFNAQTREQLASLVILDKVSSTLRSEFSALNCTFGRAEPVKVSLTVLLIPFIPTDLKADRENRQKQSYQRTVGQTRSGTNGKSVKCRVSFCLLDLTRSGREWYSSDSFPDRVSI